MLNSFLWTLNGFFKSILGPETRMYSGEESCRDALTLSAGLRWGFEPLCLLGDKALTLVWLRLGNNSRLWTSCWQVTTWWWLFYLCLLMCCVALLIVFSIKTSGSDLHLFLPLRVTLSIGTQLRLWESTCSIWQTLRALRNPFTLSELLHSLSPFSERYTSCTARQLIW